MVNSTARFRVLSCGRRWGKTRLGTVECTAIGARGGRAWWVAPSYKMAAVGWRGVSWLSQQIPGTTTNKAERLITYPGGGTVQVRSADDPNSLRGEGLDFAVLDECAYMKEAAWFEALRPTLSDRQGRAMFISTPKGLNWFRDLWMMGENPDYPDWQNWQFSTSDNPYIAPEEIEAARLALPLRIFRQEYLADFMEDNPGALWRRDWIQRTTRAPDLERVIVAVDPSTTATGDACGIVVCGRDGDRFYLLDDLTLQGSPAQWGAAVVTAYHKYEADAVIAEKNQGGEMVTLTIQQSENGRGVPVSLVHASRGKRTRAEPVSALYEQGRGYHVGSFPALEDEMCQWEPGQPSPNRMDALVWGASELLIKSNSPSFWVV